MPQLDSIVRLMDITKKLRSIADELGQVDLKSQLVDELIQLEEIREELIDGGTEGAGTATAHNGSSFSSEPQSQQFSLGESPRFSVLEPPTDGESYELSLGGNEEEEDEAVAPAPVETATLTKVKEKKSSGHKKGDSEEVNVVAEEKPSDTLTDEDRFRLAEEALRDIEPIHLAALQKMNDILTDEQRQKKQALTKKYVHAGKKGRDLQQSVMAALKLSSEQETELATAKKELQQVRTAMAKHVENMLSPEQTQQLLKRLGKDHR